jgi:hypothetical protein
LSSRELGPEDWDGRRIRRPLQRASVEARRSSFKGDNKGETETKGTGAGALQLDGGQGSTQRLNAASANGDGGGGIGLPVQGVVGSGTADERSTGLGSKA